MDKNTEISVKSMLFEQIDAMDLKSLLSCLGAKRVKKTAGEIFWAAGDKVTAIGMIVYGRLQVIREDAAGNRAIIAELNAGELFGESFVCAGEGESPVSVEAVTDCEVIFIPLQRILTPCTAACDFHNRLVANLLKIISQKNMLLNQKIDILSRRNLRDKLMAYFLLQIDIHKKNQFEIPFSRSQLADYLCVDRSAMSRELGKMRDEGILEFNKNRFRIIVL